MLSRKTQFSVGDAKKYFREDLCVGGYCRRRAAGARPLVRQGSRRSGPAGSHAWRGTRPPLREYLSADRRAADAAAAKGIVIPRRVNKQSAFSRRRWSATDCRNHRDRNAAVGESSLKR